MRKLFIAGVVGLSVSVFAADKVWNGSAGDRKWSTAANWIGSQAPVSGDSVWITLSSAMTVTNDISGLSVNGLVISNTAAAGIAGETISLAGNASIVAGANLTLSVPFGGSGTITRNGAGYLYLSGNSSGFAGAWVFTNGHTYVTHSSALGASAPVTLYGNTAADTCSLRIDAAGTYANPMTFYKGSSQIYYSYKTLTNAAPIVCYGQTRLMANPGSMYIQGGLTSMDNTGVIFNSAGSNKIVLENTPPNLGTAQFYFDTGWVDVAVPGVWGSMLVAKGTVRTLAENVLGTNGFVRIGIGYGQWGTLDVNGFNQKVNGLYSDTGVDASNPKRIISAAPVLLESISTVTQTFNGSIDGAISFRMSGTGRQNFDKGVSTTRGEMVCARGLIGLSPESQFTALSALVITNTGYMVVTSPKVNRGLIRVRIADSGILDIGTGVEVEAFDAQVDGVYLAPGVYTKNNLARLTGNGSLKVLTAGTVEPVGRFVWNGAGSDTSVRTEGNWIDAVAPTFNRTETLVFSDGTATASLAGEIDVYALNFRTNANFTLSAGDSAAKINLGAGGLSVSNQAIPFVAYEVVPAIELQAPQFWPMHSNSTASLTLRGAISGGNSNWNWIVSGPSALHLYGDNTFVSRLIASNGCLRIYSDTALGSPTRPVTVIGDSPKAYNHVFFEGPVRTNDVPLVLASYIGDICRSGQTLVLNGSVTALGGSGDSHIRIPGAVIARGGLDGTANRFWIQMNGGPLTVENKPIFCANNDFSQDDFGTIVLSATNNVWRTYYVYGGVLRCGTSNVLTSTLSFGAVWKRYGTLNLNGFNQRLDALRTGTTADLTSNYCVTSPTPAVLTITPATNTISFSGYFAGEAGLHYAVSTGVFTFDALPSTTKGALRVSNGTVAFTGGAGWLGSTNVILTGTGTLRVQAASAGVAFGTAATGWNTHLIMADSGKLQLDAGTAETVKFLQINGVEMPRGTYGAAGSGARFIDDVHFSGSGVLTVRAQNIIGTILRVN